MENSERRTSVPRSVFFVIFTISGFAGLIYESIWSHYLKLFLGHAAYAQTLVLAIFMGGMAIGAHVCARYTERWKNLLIGYAIAELVIGLLAITFHGIFVGIIAFAYDSLFPALESPAAVNIIKWLIAGVLILPQSILLGMTFPLMSAGIMRLYPQTPGASLAMLYFTNSLGAAVGVLASGFFLIERFGMPGTLLTAGLLNVGLAIAVWATEKRKYLDVIDAAPAPTLAHEGGPSRMPTKQSLRLLLTVSLVTGVASFCYEIGWIRMLSLVLGSSTHAFEIMLSAFIFGIAFGGLWIKGRIDGAKSLVALLGVVLAGKGVMALATLPVYGNTFEIMQLTIAALAKTDFAYTSFNISSHLISLSVMFPAAFCAGMSLPLITCSLLRDGHGEGSIGKVYAWNTLGAIIGVLFAVHIGMPMLGLKNLIIVGAVLDIGIALVLVAKMREQSQSRLFPSLAVIGCLAIVTSTFVLRLDTDKMASGVYRHGKLKVAGDGEVIFHRDGKTATVDVIKSGPLQSILTNGKTDAAIFMSGEAMAGDEPTMVMLGALPLAHKPGAVKVANIGFGSGMTTHTLLGSTAIMSVDTIEIEPAMIEGARTFGPMVARAFNDPRSSIHIEDAKSFFAGRNEKYDVVVSEPSNPWVSGVSGLFSDEFYKQVKRYIRDDGILVQWIQLYEIDTPLVLSMLKALGNNFEDYVAYEAGPADMVILAVPKGKIPPLSDAALAMPLLKADFERIGVKNIGDIRMRRIASKQHFEILAKSYGVRENSDYFPIVDLRAPKLRFLGRTALDLSLLSSANIPIVDMLDRYDFPGMESVVAPIAMQSQRPQRAVIAAGVREVISDGRLRAGGKIEQETLLRSIFIRDTLINCIDAENRSAVRDVLFDLGPLLSAQLGKDESVALWQKIESAKCHGRLSVETRNLIAVFKAVSDRDASGMAIAAERVLDSATPATPAHLEYLVLAGMAGHYFSGNVDAARSLWLKRGNSLTADGRGSPPFRLMVGLLGEDSPRRATR